MNNQDNALINQMFEKAVNQEPIISLMKLEIVFDTKKVNIFISNN